MTEQQTWLANNDKHLSASLAWLRLLLRDMAPPVPAQEDEDCSSGWFSKKEKTKITENDRLSEEKIENARQEMATLENTDRPPALMILSQRLGLSKFDRQVLMLCVAMELDPWIAKLCAQAQNNTAKPYPTFGLAFVLFNDPDWGALSPNASLRYWRLLEINQPAAIPLTASAIQVDERILNYLKGLNYLDDRLTSLVEPVANQHAGTTLPDSQQHIVDQILIRVQSLSGLDTIPVVELLGHDGESKRLIASQVCLQSNSNLYAIDIKAVPPQTTDLETFTRLWERESLLMPISLYIKAHDFGETEKTVLKQLVQKCTGLIFIDKDQTRLSLPRPKISFEINKPTRQEQEVLWSETLGEDAQSTDTTHLAKQFSFSQAEITRISRNTLMSHPTNEIGDALWRACLMASRPNLEQLVQRIKTKATWKQIVLPAEQEQGLRRIAQQVKHRDTVYDNWGFRQTMNRGFGISVLFAGESGTGKTMAAEVIANELKLDLYRIDLSAVVNKYIGETEKNLRKVFDAAEDSGAILLFDEADALFGKRSEVKDSHDRYANIEINYLLQRMESYSGLAILATNMKNAMDKAFLRRLRFIIDFPFPDAALREEMWRKVFPADAPIDEQLDYKRLSKLNLTGGSIHNIALNASFLAAQENTTISMPLILNAARSEFRKLERPAKESDFQWQGPTGVVA